MELSGLHFLLTYQCIFECDHCFVWSSPQRRETMTIGTISAFLRQAKETNFVQWIYFEGGEPFLYYGSLLIGVKLAKEMGFKVGLVTNAYWAKSTEDALIVLKPFQKYLDDLSFSCDLYHRENEDDPEINAACEAAGMLKIPFGVIRIRQVIENQDEKEGYGEVMFKGRAAEKLVADAPGYSWQTFNECPHEDFSNPGRVHVDPLGNLQICQGIVIGNLFHESLTEICKKYSPENSQLLNIIDKEGPVGLVKHFDLPHQEEYADACHLCYEMRKQLRPDFPKILAPSQMYGESI